MDDEIISFSRVKMSEVFRTDVRNTSDIFTGENVYCVLKVPVKGY